MSRRLLHFLILEETKWPLEDADLAARALEGRRRDAEFRCCFVEREME